MDKDHIIQELIEKVNHLTIRLEQAEKKIATLEAENTELKSRLNSNSKNSSRPPSSDGYKKKPAFPKKENGKQGGQKGHKGRTLQQVNNPDKIVKCHPDKCNCGHKFTKDQLVLSETRQIFDLPQPKLEVTEYQIHKATCPVCGKTQKGIAPENIFG